MDNHGRSRHIDLACPHVQFVQYVQLVQYVHWTGCSDRLFLSSTSIILQLKKSHHSDYYIVSSLKDNDFKNLLK